MKKFLILAFVLVLLLASVTPVVAGGGNGRHRGLNAADNVVRLNGEITAIDADALTLTILVTSGGDYKGDTITVQVTSTTRLRLKVADGCVPITFDYLEVGQGVGVTGAFAGGVLFARVVVVQVDV